MATVDQVFKSEVSALLTKTVKEKGADAHVLVDRLVDIVEWYKSQWGGETRTGTAGTGTWVAEDRRGEPPDTGIIQNGPEDRRDG